MFHRVPICCFCEKVQDDVGAEIGQETWLDLRTYMTKHRLWPDDIKFSYTYCPACWKTYKDLLAS